jgi:hypothetical protein
MKQILPVVVVCLASWGLVALAGGASKAVFFGMLGPLVAVAATWVVTVRTYRIDPARVGPVLMAAFGVKMLFFGGYVAFVTKMLDIRSIAFVVSFVTYFLALYVVQALLLRRLTWTPVA